MNRLASLAASLIFAAGMGIGSASAATFSSCTGTGYDISNATSGAANCAISDDFNQDFSNTNPMTVNTSPGFFNMTDWVFGGKIGDDTGYTGSGSGLTGTWDISTPLSNLTVDDVMLVFKPGNGTTLVGYLLNSGVTSGSWDTPFVEPAFSFPGNSSQKDVSHISVYYTVGSTTVPLPGSVVLLMGALGALVVVRRRTA